MEGPILLTSTHLLQKNDLEGGLSWFHLPLLFGASDKAKGIITTLRLGHFSRARL